MFERVVTTVANGAWGAACLPAWAEFRRALHRPQAVQSGILSRLLRANESSAYGRRLGFSEIRSTREFQDVVPAVSYEDIEPWVARIMRGDQRILTTEPVVRMEKTSGSTAPAKYVPYTASLLAEFQRAVRSWIVDLFLHYPSMLAGKAYWSLTPVGKQPEVTAGGLRVGFDSDEEYFGWMERALLRRILAVPDRASGARDFDECMHVTAESLGRCSSLAFISVWNPSLLTILLDRIGADPERLWPHLQVISCWADAHAKHALPALRRRFPHVEIQGKGLLATEGVVSIPLVGAAGCALALTSHFFEFIEREGERPRLAHELELDRVYSLLITTGGGLWRYRLGDRVRVTGFVGRTPLLEFIGREENLCDLCGEKLSANFAGAVLEALGPATFVMLAPSPAQSGSRSYTLYVEGAEISGAALDAKLRANPQYDYARRLGQLAEARVFAIQGGAHAAYLRRCEALGRRAGSVKPTPLSQLSDWDEWFDGGARGAAESVVAHAPRFYFDLAAGDEDDEQLRAILRRNPMGDSIRVAFEREPSALGAARIQGDLHQIGVARDRIHGRIVGLGSRSIANAFLNGRPQPLGYLGDLRLDSAFRGGTILVRAYRFLRDLHRDGRARLYTTVIFQDNAFAMKNLAAARAGLPEYHDCGLIRAPGLRIKRRLPAIETDVAISRGASAHLSEVIDCLNRNNERRQFAPAHCREDFEPGGRWRDFHAEDFYVARRAGRVAGVLGKWDQHRFKQTRVVGYRGVPRLLRPALRLPRPGECLRYFHGSFIAIDGDDLGVFRALLRQMYNDAVGGEHQYFLLGLHERDPLSAALDEYSLIPFNGRLFCISFADGEELRRSLDGRTPYVEVATL